MSGTQTAADHRAGICEHFSAIRQDLGQAQRLVEDAVDGLVCGFLKVSALSRSQQELCTCNSPLAGSDTARSALMADEIERTANVMVQNMQFQDLVSQLLGHAKRQIDVLEDVVVGWDDPADALRRAADIALYKPVAIEGMRDGEIDLF